MAIIDPEHPWLKQPWESKTSFDIFSKYYLPQKINPRSLVYAYHEYLVQEKGLTFDEAKKKHVPGHWMRYAKGEDSYGRTIYGSLTFAQRAEAYDKITEDIKQEYIETQKLTVIDDELRDYHAQLEVWKDLLASLTSKIQREKILKGDKFDPARHTGTMDRIVKIRENIAIFGRRTAGLPASIKEERVADAEGKKFSIEWKEPFGDDEEIGIGAEIIKTIVRQQEEMNKTYE